MVKESLNRDPYSFENWISGKNFFINIYVVLHATRISKYTKLLGIICCSIWMTRGRSQKHALKNARVRDHSD